MNIEEMIAESLAQAEPLRKLDDDDPAKAPLGRIVDSINALRWLQSVGKTTVEGDVKPKRGRPAKVEGEDA